MSPLTTNITFIIWFTLRDSDQSYRKHKFEALYKVLMPSRYFSKFSATVLSVNLAELLSFTGDYSK